MKLFFVLFSIVITGIFTFYAPVKNIKGTWVMQADTGVCSPVIIRIKLNEGIWQGKLDIPAQQVYDKAISDISVKGDSVFIKIAEGGNVIKASLVNENILAGDLFTDGRKDTVRFIKLKDQ